MSYNVISQKPIIIKPLTTQYFLLTYYIPTYLLKSNPTNHYPAGVGIISSVTRSFRGLQNPVFDAWRLLRGRYAGGRLYRSVLCNSTICKRAGAINGHFY